MSNSQPLTRPHFFAGKLLTAKDLKDEQTYLIEKSKRHNRWVHGFGIVFGLRVKTNGGKITVSEGSALDCEGNEIVVCSSQTLSISLLDSDVAFVNLKYAERFDGPTTVGEPSSITEAFELVIAKSNENSGHRHVRGRWLACGKPHSLTLAKLRRGSRGWRVDRRHCPPAIK